MSKIAREMYESCLRELLWQASEDLGAEITSRLAFEILGEHTRELAAFAAEQGVVISKPEKVS